MDWDDFIIKQLDNTNQESIVVIQKVD